MSVDEQQGEARLYALFDRHGIGWEHFEHPPLRTVADAQAAREALPDAPGAHVKNLFLKEKRGQLWLVTCLEHRQIRIRDLERAIGAKNCSFGKPELLAEALGVLPGAVTPFAVVNDTEGRVRVALDRAIAGAPQVYAHPLHNRATAAVATADLERLFAVTGHAPLWVDFDALEALAAEAARSGAAAGGEGRTEP